MVLYPNLLNSTTNYILMQVSGDDCSFAPRKPSESEEGTRDRGR